MVGLFMIVWMVYVAYVLRCIHNILKSDGVHPVKHIKKDVDFIRSKKNDKKDNADDDIV